jgi:hypothetical protein
VFVVAIVLALVSSLFLLPALYTPFLKQDAKKFVEESKVSILVNAPIGESE